MNLDSTFQYLSTKNNFPSIKSIFKRSPLIFFLTLISFYVAKPTDIFSKIPLQNHWQFFLAFPTIAILVYILSWVILDTLIPAYYKRNNWSNGKSFALKFLIAFLILLSFHFFNSLLNIHSSISFFLGIGLPLSLFPALYFISLESQIPVNTETPVIPVFEDSDSALLFIETQSAHIKRWNQPQTRRPQVYAYYEKGEEVHLKLTKFDTLEDFILKQSTEVLMESHKSYCVNPHQIVAGIGNSKSFSVLMGSLHYEVPVSRDESEKIIAFLKQNNKPLFSTIQSFGKPTIPIWQKPTH